MRKLLRFLTSLVRRKQPAHSFDSIWLDCLNRLAVLDRLREQFRIMAQSICAVLRLAEEPVTQENIMAFASSLPRLHDDFFSNQWQSEYCFRCLKKAFGHTNKSKEFDKLFGYIETFTKESDLYKGETLSILLGVLDGLSLDGKW